MEKELVIKALECCANNDECVGEACPYYKTGCEKSMPKDALSLIKELTEESKKWEQAYECADSACRELSDKCERLTEENERLKLAPKIGSVSLPEALEIINKYCESGIKRAKADTVRKMHSEIKERCIKGGIYPAFVKSTIDQIAKEMLEGE